MTTTKSKWSKNNMSQMICIGKRKYREHIPPAAPAQTTRSQPTYSTLPTLKSRRAMMICGMRLLSRQQHSLLPVVSRVITAAFRSKIVTKQGILARAFHRSTLGLHNARWGYLRRVLVLRVGCVAGAAQVQRTHASRGPPVWRPILLRVHSGRSKKPFARLAESRRIIKPDHHPSTQCRAFED